MGHAGVIHAKSRWKAVPTLNLQPHGPTMGNIPIGFLAGILAIGLWAYSDFHRPFQRGEIRRSVSLNRYVFGVGVYICGYVFAFSLITQLYDVAFKAMFAAVAEPSSEQANGAHALRLFSSASPGAAAISVAILMLINEIPVRVLRYPTVLARRAAQELAYYPKSIELILLLLSNVQFRGDDRADKLIAEELERYGIEYEDVVKQTLLARAVTVAREIESVRFYIGKITAGELEPPSVRMFFLRGEYRLCDADLKRAQFLHHLASAFLIEGAVQSSTTGVEAVANLGRILEDEGNFVLSLYRRIIGEAALSQVSTGEKRSQFLHEFGYNVPPFVALPFWPVVLCFLVVAGSMFVAQTIIYYLRGVYDVGGWINLAVIIFNQSLTQSMGVMWAIGPKFNSLIARPSLKSLPISSYLIVGLCSYLSSVVFFNVIFAANEKLPLAVSPFVSSTILSIQPLCSTLVIAVLTDMHLMGRNRSEWYGRIFDGVTVGIVAAASQVLVSSLLPLLVTGFRPYTSPLSNLFPAWLGDILNAVGFSEFSIAFACVGFVIGFVVPVTASDALVRSQNYDRSGRPTLPELETVRGRLPPRVVISVRETVGEAAVSSSHESGAGPEQR
jgi:hypothetical protein